MAEERGKWFHANSEAQPDEDDDVEAHSLSGSYSRHGGKDSEREHHGGKDSEREHHGGKDS
jgi:hypothetical protein